MRILVTGGTGFLGAHFIQQACQLGHEVIASRRPGALPRIPLPNDPQWFVGDLSEIDQDILNGCDALVHFAANGVSPQQTDWETALNVNVCQSMSLVDKACRAGVGRILLCGSCMEYGFSAANYERIPTDAPLKPIGPYAASKAAFSMAAASYARDATSEFVLLRPFHFYGEGQHEANFWPALRRAALAGEDFAMTRGEQIRDFQPVQDAAKSFLHTLEDWPGTQGTIHIANLGSGKPVTLANFAKEQWSRWQAQGELKIGALPYRDNEVMRYLPQLYST